MLFVSVSKQTSTPPPDWPNIGTTAPQSIDVPKSGLILQRNIAGKKLAAPCETPPRSRLVQTAPRSAATRSGPNRGSVSVWNFGIPSCRVRETVGVLARMNTQPDYAAAWRDLRRRRIIFWAVFLSYIPGVWAIFFAVGLPLSALTGIEPDHFGLAIASCWMAAFAVTGWRLGLFSCPRCHKRFFATWWYHNPFARKCLNCGLPNGANSEPPISN